MHWIAVHLCVIMHSEFYIFYTKLYPVNQTNHYEKTKYHMFVGSV